LKLKRNSIVFWLIITLGGVVGVEIILLILIVYGVLIWTYFNPEKSLLQGRRGMYKEEPQLTESAIRNTKAKALISIIVITLIIIIFIIK